MKTNQFTTRQTRTPANNSTNKKFAVQWLNETLCPSMRDSLLTNSWCSEIANFFSCKTLNIEELVKIKKVGIKLKKQLYAKKCLLNFLKFTNL